MSLMCYSFIHYDYFLRVRIAPSKLSKAPSKYLRQSSPTRQSQAGEVFQASPSLGGSLLASTGVGPAWKAGHGSAVISSVAKPAGVMTLSEKRSGINLAEKIQPLSYAALQQPEEQTDNWDDDFEDGISFTKLQGVSLLKSSIKCG